MTGAPIRGRVYAAPMQSQDSSDDTTPRQAHEQPQLGRADLLPRALVVMRESVSGVPPRSHSGSKSHSMIRARAYGQVTLLAGLGSCGVGPQRHPTLALSPSRLQRGVSMIHRTSGLVSSPVRPRGFINQRIFRPRDVYASGESLPLTMRTLVETQLAGWPRSIRRPRRSQRAGPESLIGRRGRR